MFCLCSNVQIKSVIEKELLVYAFDFVLSSMLILIHESYSFLALQELQCQQEVLMNNILSQQESRVFKELCLLSLQMPDPVLPKQWYCLDDYPRPPLSTVGCTLELSNTAEASRKKKNAIFLFQQVAQWSLLTSRTAKLMEEPSGGIWPSVWMSEEKKCNNNCLLHMLPLQQNSHFIYLILTLIPSSDTV